MEPVGIDHSKADDDQSEASQTHVPEGLAPRTGDQARAQGQRDRKAGAKKKGAVLQGEIRRIPPLLRDVFILRDVDELDMPEVAENLRISIAAAKSRLLRARLELRQRMEKHCGRLGAASLTA